MKPNFQFYEVVRVKTRSRYPHLVGKLGAILGMAQDDHGAWSYAVFIFDFSESWSMLATQLEPTGETLQATDFYDGTRITVVVNELGEGNIKQIPNEDIN